VVGQVIAKVDQAKEEIVDETKRSLQEHDQKQAARHDETTDYLQQLLLAQKANGDANGIDTDAFAERLVDAMEKSARKKNLRPFALSDIAKPRNLVEIGGAVTPAKTGAAAVVDDGSTAASTATGVSSLGASSAQPAIDRERTWNEKVAATDPTASNPSRRSVRSMGQHLQRQQRGRAKRATEDAQRLHRR
jgi:hypothetical protein